MNQVKMKGYYLSKKTAAFIKKESDDFKQN